MHSKTPLVTLVTINYNTTGVTCELLRSIRRCNTYPALEVIVVDNASQTDPTADIKKVYPEANVILNEKNLGFSGGNNRGIQLAKGEFIFLVNNDTEFTEGLIEGLLRIFTLYPDAGAVSPKFHSFYHKGVIEYAGYEPINVFTGRNGMVGFGEEDQGQYDQVRETNYAHGGAMMVPRKVIEQVGLMPEEFFLYYEELDWCEQIKRKGYKIYYQPASLIYHKESMSTGKQSPLKTFYHNRNRILFMKRNVSGWQFLFFSLYFIFFTIPKNSVVFMLRKQRKHLVSFWKGIFWHFNPRVTNN